MKDGHEVFATLDSFAPIMDIRDRFACAAMQGDMSSQSPNVFMINHCVTDEELSAVCRHWYRIADAMLKERDK